jgi:hypothetical protein
MSGTPDYSAYHLHELQRALEQLDEAAHPDEARTIREYIAKGGYVYPTEAAIAKVVFVNAIYKWSLVVVLASLAVFNFAAVAVSHKPFALIPLVLQVALLSMIRREHKYTRAVIKVWSVLLMLGALLRLWSMAYATEVDAVEIADRVITLAIGLAFLLFADRCVELVPVASETVEQSTVAAPKPADEASPA